MPKPSTPCGGFWNQKFEFNLLHALVVVIDGNVGAITLAVLASSSLVARALTAGVCTITVTTVVAVRNLKGEKAVI
jgi:hypothetical protein